MRSYGQHCGLAKALDVIGDRWNLLIVRELTIQEACRYTDLQNGLPGIATNLLADRLRDLEQSGVITREDAPPPVATALFRLTERGRALEPVVRQLGRWGAPLLAKAPKSDSFRCHWLTLPASEWLEDHAPHLPPICIELRASGQSAFLETESGKVRTRIGSAAKPDAVLAGTPQLILAVLAGKLTLAAARTAGLRYMGDPETLRRLQPRSAGTETASIQTSPSSDAKR